MSIQRLARILSSLLLAAVLNAAVACPASSRIRSRESIKTTVESENATAVQGKTVIRGEVVDNAGAVVPALTVEIRTAVPRGSSSKPQADGSRLTVRTNREGEFSASVMAGSYDVCVARFPKSCRTVLVNDALKPEHLRLQIHPSDDPATSELLDRRIRTIAGHGAQDCGHVRATESAAHATKCALHAFKHHEKFYVRYDLDVDAELVDGIASDSSGNVYAVEFHSMSINWERMPPAATLPDGLHTKVIPCSEPVRLRVDRKRGELVCFANGHWLGDK
jgi:hypothetical protein